MHNTIVESKSSGLIISIATSTSREDGQSILPDLIHVFIICRRDDKLRSADAIGRRYTSIFIENFSWVKHIQRRMSRFIYRLDVEHWSLYANDANPLTFDYQYILSRVHTIYFFRAIKRKPMRKSRCRMAISQ